jgi:UDP-glucose 4-epimerase
MRVLVTGGAGFIGSHLVRALLGRDHEPVVLDDLSTGRRSAVPARVAFEQADVSDPATAERIRDLRPAAIVHAAAQVSVERSVRDPDRDEAVNVRGTAIVLDGARAAGAQRFVFVSSGGAVYGSTKGADEVTPPAPESPYGRNKLAAERLVAEAGISSAIARLANVYGPGQRSDLEGGVVAIFSEAIRAGGPVVVHGDGGQARDFVHVDDVADALCRMVEDERIGIWNVGTGVATSVIGLLSTLERVSERSLPIDHAPARPGDVRDSCLRVERIARDLGWRPRLDLAAGLAQTLTVERSR